MNREKQQSEFEAIAAIFGEDVEDLRVKKTDHGWRPLHLRIHLSPLRSERSEPSPGNVHITMRLVCSGKYPERAVPRIILENAKGLSDKSVEQLQEELTEQAQAMVGREMIYDLCTIAQEFLQNHHTPLPASFYEEMTKRDLERELKERMEATIQQQSNKLEIEKRKEMLRQSQLHRGRKDSIEPLRSPKRSVSIESGQVEVSSPWPYFRSHMDSNECIEHMQSEKIVFPQAGKQIQRGCCLGHSQKGCVAYSGINCDNGQLQYITEWVIKYDYLRSICNESCSETRRNSLAAGDGNLQCSKHNVDQIISYIETQTEILSKLKHENLITYRCVLVLKKTSHLKVYLVQDFVHGTSLNSISSTLGWCTEGVGKVAKGILDALTYLHNNSVFHKQLIDTTVFMDNTGTIRVTDFSLVPYLQRLIGGPRTNMNDLPALGAIIESMMPTHSSDMRDFIEQCKSNRTLSTVQLSSHIFLQPIRVQPLTPIVEQVKEKSSKALSVSHFLAPKGIDHGVSRLANEFQFIQFLGRGAQGDVIKVRNILDNQLYAIKRIPLRTRKKEFYIKIRREVELLSRLNHENVVRYYNSWIENGLPEADFGQSEEDNEDDVSSDSSNKSRISAEDEDSSDWSNLMSGDFSDDDDEGIEFLHTIEGDINDIISQTTADMNIKCKSPRIDQYMYIQMEFCEKSTLRTAIDGGLYENNERLWRLFREIVEGLAHIHQQGMIHRDLKPVNVFLDSRDQVKIGDFGLATTDFLAVKNQLSSHGQSESADDKLTGYVGTALYIAPELNGNVSKVSYNNKVDLYSLGIIFFEMSVPAFETGMERIKTIHDIRKKEIIFPEKCFQAGLEQNVNVMKWLLQHDPSHRPTAQQLLSSDLLPPPRLEATELQEMLRNVLANPHKKIYKHLVAHCLSQRSTEILEVTYHLDIVMNSVAYRHVKERVIRLLRLHGAVEVTTPLLTPLMDNQSAHNSVKLMTHSGCVVVLPYDLRSPFATWAAINGITPMRRYSIERVYREKKAFNFHPKQLHECAFDIINENPGNLLVDAEVLTIAYRISAEFTVLKEMNVTIRMNHTKLLEAILIHCNVPKEKNKELYKLIGDFIENKLTRFQLNSAVSSLLPKNCNTTILIELMLTECPIGAKKSVTGTALKAFLKGRSEAASLANGAYRELEHVINLAEQMGVSCPINLNAGIVKFLEKSSPSGIIWHLVADLKASSKRGRSEVLAVGGRYDKLLSDLQEKATTSGALTVSHKKLCGVGFSFILDKLVYALGPSFTSEYRSIDVLLCVPESRPPFSDIAQILTWLWTLNIRSGILDNQSIHDAEASARDLGARHLIVVGDGGSLRVRTLEQHGVVRDQQMSRPEFMEYFRKSGKMVKQLDVSESSSRPDPSQSKPTNSNHNIEIVFALMEKLIPSYRKRIENQILNQMQPTFDLFNTREPIKVYAIDCEASVIGAFVGTIDRRCLAKKTSSFSDHRNEEFAKFFENYPRYKKTFHNLYEKIEDESVSIIALFSIRENYYRFLL